MNRKGQLPTITIGIPAYNEEQNIIYLLKSLLKQKTTAYKLQNIFVISDGSTDKTESKVKELSKKYKMIKLLADHKRKGKGERLNELYKKNKSDFVFSFDADHLLGEKNVLDSMIKQFIDKNVVLVCCGKRPVTPKNFVEKLICGWYGLIDDIKNRHEDGHTIHSVTSSGYAVRRSFARKVKHTKELVAHAQQIFFLAQRQRKSFRFAKDAMIYYRIPNTMRDYLKLIFRFGDQKIVIAKNYGDWIYESYHIPFSKKLYGLTKMFLMHPLITPITILFHVIVPKLPHKQLLSQQGFWQITQSSKKAIRKV